MPTDYKTFRQQWNTQQKELRTLFDDPAQHETAVSLFLRHHAVLHNTQINNQAQWSYADDLLQDVTPEQMRRLPENGEHSIAWVLWHMARIEDVAMNMLVADTPQILHQDNWLQQMQMTYHHTGNETSASEIKQLNEQINIEALLAYRLAVGQRTQEIGQQLQPADITRKVNPAHITQILADGSVIAAASGVTDYWSKRTVAGLLLMPATRHNMVHLNEIEKIKKQVI